MHPKNHRWLFVGQGIQQTDLFGSYVFDIFTGQLLDYQAGKDLFAWRQAWGAFDSNPLIDPQTEYLFWPAENGLIYRYSLKANKPFAQPVKFRYKVKNKYHQGLEASFAAYKNQGFFADNSGNLFALDLETLRPLWYFDNLDDTNASIALDLEGEIPYLYVGNEVDKQGQTGKAYFRKINGLTGQAIWSQARICNSDQRINGGILSSALIGKKKPNIWSLPFSLR